MSVPQDQGPQTEEQERPATVIINHNVGRPGDSLPSYGSGTLEMLEVINLLGSSGIPSCVVGTHPLRYYGAGRVPNVGLALYKCSRKLHHMTVHLQFRIVLAALYSHRQIG